MKEVRFHPEARAELRAAARFYQSHVPDLGRELVQEVRVVITRISEWPQSGSPSEDVRRVVLPRFPFAVVYQVVGEAIEIIAIMHQRQMPGYWRHRM